jgi:hypothetical protein
MEERHPAEADAAIALGREHIAKQRAIIARLKANGGGEHSPSDNIARHVPHDAEGT